MSVTIENDFIFWCEESGLFDTKRVSHCLIFWKCGVQACAGIGAG